MYCTSTSNSQVTLGHHRRRVELRAQTRQESFAAWAAACFLVLAFLLRLLGPIQIHRIAPRRRHETQRERKRSDHVFCPAIRGL